MEFVYFIVRSKFLVPLILLLLISVGSGFDSTDEDQKVGTVISPYVTSYLNFTAAKIDEIICYYKRFLHFVAEDIVPWIKDRYVNRHWNFTAETTLQEVIASVRNFDIFLVDQKFKEYSYLFVFNGLIILSVWYYLSPPTKRMKVTRRKHKIPKAALRKTSVFISKNSEKTKAT
ncbi:hypothetical protein C5167_035394 [Papaver somniferum]|uniref:Uncharacterized protein n=1 Tax=Papaver somniferum TaxID=3469 RepID=A0A4Y7KEF4_PAPSO|nr:uncharacterized protein LOC113292977 [Papaver somniferum]RZC70295.1 hypothetical protein C5167_035394 [Papaver somniferum]